MKIEVHPQSRFATLGVINCDLGWVHRTFGSYRNRTTDGLWLRSQDADPAFMIPLRSHYSGAGGGRCGLPPGRKLVLTAPDGLSIAGFTLQKYRADEQEGICCNVFARWGGSHMASALIRDATRIAREQIGDHRFFTFVQPSAVGSENPGYCFKRAGWKTCGRTKKGLHILEL